MPAKTRASLTSKTACEKLEKLRADFEFNSWQRSQLSFRKGSSPGLERQFDGAVPPE